MGGWLDLDATSRPPQRSREQRSLIRAAHCNEQSHTEEQPPLPGFLDNLEPADHSLELDAADHDRVPLWTIHGAKDIDAENMMVIGVEEGLLHDYRLSGDRESLEGERNVL